MAAMLMTLTEFSDKENNRTFTRANHSAAKPKLLIQKRKTPTGVSGVAEDTLTVLDATEDADGNILASKVAFTVTFRRPINGQAAETTNALADFRDLVASDEFGNVVSGQLYVA